MGFTSIFYIKFTMYNFVAVFFCIATASFDPVLPDYKQWSSLMTCGSSCFDP